jgi:hypothetical protein
LLLALFLLARTTSSSGGGSNSCGPLGGTELHQVLHHEQQANRQTFVLHKRTTAKNKHVVSKNCLFGLKKSSVLLNQGSC